MDGSLTKRWEEELERWLEPFLQRLRRKAQRRWAPIYLKGLLLPGERKSVEPMAARVAPADTQQLHHFVATSPWATAPLEDELVKAADRLVGGPDAVLVVDDTALVKQGRHSVGVKRQYCGQPGKRANCQSLVSLTLARSEVPVGVGLRLFLPEDWSGDATHPACGGGRARRGRVPAEVADRARRDRPRAGRGRPLRRRPGRRRVRQGGRVPRRPRGATAPLRRGHHAGPAGLPGRRHARLSRARGDRPPAQAPGALRRERGRGRADRGPAGGVPRRLVADRHQGTARGRVRRDPGARGGRSGRRRRTAPPR